MKTNDPSRPISGLYDIYSGTGLLITEKIPVTLLPDGITMVGYTAHSTEDLEFSDDGCISDFVNDVKCNWFLKPHNKHYDH